MEDKQMWNYGVLYAAWFAVIWLAANSIDWFFPAFEMPPGMFSMGSASMVHDRFLKDNGRLASRREYWTLVGLSTCLSLVLEMLTFGLFLALNRLSGPSPSAWLTVGPLVLVLSLFGNMAMYSSFMGRAFLKHRRPPRP